MKPTAGRSLTGAKGGGAEQSGWRVGRPGRRRSCRSLWNTRGGSCERAPGCVWPGEAGGFSLQQLVVGSRGAPRPGCAGAPSQFESGGGAEWVQQSSPEASIAARCPPPPLRAARCCPAAGVRAAARPPAPLPPPPPLPRRPPLPPRRLHTQIPPAAAASPAPRLGSFLSLLLFSPSHRHLLASTLSCSLQSTPDPCASRCQEVSRGQRISGQRISSLRIAAAAAARRPREGAPGAPRAASEAERGGPGLRGSRLVASSCFSPPPPKTRNPLLVGGG